ncbi:hypothetical protein U060_02554, partial [Staphylococcus aureus KINW6047]
VRYQPNQKYDYHERLMSVHYNQ